MDNDVSFDDDAVYDTAPYQSASKKIGGILGFVINVGIAKSAKEATIVLCVVIAVCIALTVVVYVAVQPHPHPLSPEQFELDLARMRAVSQGSK